MSFLPPGAPEERRPMVQLRTSKYRPEPLLRPRCKEDHNVSIVEFVGIGPEGRLVNFERIFDFTWTIKSILELLRYKCRTKSDQIFEISFSWKQGNLHRELNSVEDVEAFVELGHGWCPQDTIIVHFFLPPTVPVLQEQLYQFLGAILMQYEPESAWP